MTSLSPKSRALLDALDAPTRVKALEIVAVIAAAGYEERAAVPVAIEHARRWLAKHSARAA